MKTYFGIVTTKDYKQIGNVFPQVQFNEEDNGLVTFLKLKSLYQKPSEIQEHLVFKLVKKAKLTDVLSQSFISTCGLLVSKRMRDFLNDFSVLNYEFIGCDVVDLNNNIHSYFFLHPVVNLVKYIDFSISKFDVFGEDNNLLNSIRVSDEKELAMKTIKLVNRTILPENNIIRLKSNFHFDDDILGFDIISNEKLFFSEQLVNKLKTKKFSGFDMTQTTIVV